MKKIYNSKQLWWLLSDLYSVVCVINAMQPMQCDKCTTD